ncbi:hypothetical protein [Fusobacterium necrophorum]|uniref:hypothetical protein n=1 Tax=Fusobacterium necrophorum TaxID=859 RepID=UPI000AF7CE46|nr:hypothetical protein [Fusobacterium necrophorum]
MRKYFLGLCMLCLSCIAWAGVNDTLNIIPKEEIPKIEEKIHEIYRKKKVKVYVNTLTEGEGFQVADPERTVILNISQDKTTQVKVVLRFSKDIDIEEEQSKMDLSLDNASSILIEGKPVEYILQVLDGVEYLLENVEISEPEILMQEVEEREEFQKGIAISLGIILLLLLKIGHDFWKKKKREQ